MAGVQVRRVPEAFLRTAAPWFMPEAEIPVFKGKTCSPVDMSDAALLELLARHPIALDALAESGGAPVAAVEERLAPLVAGRKLAIENHDGVRMVRVLFA